MGHTSRSSFAQGWQPNADRVNAPATALLRADNLILDEQGVLALRAGSALVNLVPFADLDVHSLFTTAIGGTRYRMAGASDAVYANGGVIASGLAGANDVAFGFQLGQILFARSTSKKKFDGATVRNWGIAMTGAAPTIEPIEADGKTFATCAQGESPAFVTIEDNGAGPTYGPNHFLVGDPGYSATGALVFHPATTNRAVYQKTFAAPTDFTTYDAGEIGSDDDILTWYLYVSDPAALVHFAIQIDVHDGTFLEDWYVSPGLSGKLPASTLDPAAGSSLDTSADVGTHVPHDGATVVGTAVPRIGLPTGSPGAGGTLPGAGWMKVSFKRGDFVRLGTNPLQTWATVKAIRVYVSLTNATTVVRVESIRITGGKNRPLLGSSTWRYVYVRNASGYLALSAPSVASDEMIFASQAAAVTIPFDASRDPQVNELWLYRRDQRLTTFYRVALQAGVAGTGAYVIDDYTSAQDALDINLPIELDNAVPPDNILAIVGPHYDRTMVLTANGQLWPSRKLDPDAFATGQAINVCGVDETPYWMVRAINELFVGTSKDIYRLEGTGAELPDGSIDYTLRPLSMDHRPVNTGLAHEGDQIAFFSDDGWRASSSMGSTLLTEETSLLYKGATRHGVAPVNVAGGRVRAALAKGHLLAITPEGAATTSSPVIYRKVFGTPLWYRHTYPQVVGWRSIYREPDGTVLAGDTAGSVWVLDSGTLDAGLPIPVVCWTKVDDLEMPYQRKKAGALHWRSDTGGAAAAIAVHLDGSETVATTLAATRTGMGVDAFDLADAIAIATQWQFRVTGSFPAFHLYDFGLGYRERPIPIIGRVPDGLAGSPGVKILSGFVLRCNTKGVARVITPFLDGVADAETFAITTSAEEPETLTLRFTDTGRRATDIGFAVDGELEVDSWSAIVTQRQPLGVLVWDSGPIDLGTKELVWLREMYLKVRAGADLVITPYFDGVPFTTVTAPVTPDVDTIVRVPVGRAYVGRQPRLVVTSCAPFYPYFVRCVRRLTGSASQKPAITVPFTLETGA